MKLSENIIFLAFLSIGVISGTILKSHIGKNYALLIFIVIFISGTILQNKINKKRVDTSNI